MIFKRGFHVSAQVSGKVGVSIVQPAHHTVKYRNAQVSQRYRKLLTPKSSAESTGFRPLAVAPDRVRDHHYNTVQQDLLLINYRHNETDKPGVKQRPWDGSSPFHINRPLRPPRGRAKASKDIKVRDWTNVPEITAITLNLFATKAKESADVNIPAKLQLQQITGMKPKTIYTRTNVPTWGIRPGMPIGCKITLKGRPMTQFLSTLTEIVLPRSKTWKGISNHAGDGTGNINFGISAEDARLFPELEGNLELWPQTFGFDVIVHTTAQVDPEARTLLSAYGFLFQNDKEKYPARW
ncbi:large ribosomal subunit protein uL5m [Trichomonascus vanleenenianus]|uniref:mitochondrial 54S ribosomal protein uL5m MRPL7 n=1 Tax=Trichomonascus vanleenenianus TaxID=2268995 RepID=UPI003EC9C5F3